MSSLPLNLYRDIRATPAGPLLEPEGPIRRTREGGSEWEPKNSSRRRWRLQQDEYGFQHTSPTHYPSWTSPRSHWSATEPRNQLPTSPTRERSGTPNLESTDHTSQTGPCWWNLATSTERLHTGQAGATHRSDRSQPESPKTPNRPNELQTDPNSKQLQHRTTANTPRRSPEQNPNKGCTGQIGQEHRSDRCSLGSSRWTAPVGQLHQIKTSISRIARTLTRLWG
jgi:hypothetical protein